MPLSVKHPAEIGYWIPFHKCRYSGAIKRSVALQYILVDHDILRELTAKTRLCAFSIAVRPSDHGRKAEKFRLVRNDIAIVRNIQLRFTHLVPGRIEMLLAHIRLYDGIDRRTRQILVVIPA